jgi:hypothetical protein
MRLSAGGTADHGGGEGERSPTHVSRTQRERVVHAVAQEPDCRGAERLAASDDTPVGC